MTDAEICAALVERFPTAVRRNEVTLEFPCGLFVIAGRSAQPQFAGALRVHERDGLWVLRPDTTRYGWESLVAKLESVSGEEAVS